MTSIPPGASSAPGATLAPPATTSGGRKAFTTAAVLLGVLALAAGSWFAVTQFTGRHEEAKPAAGQQTRVAAGQQTRVAAGASTGGKPSSASAPDPEKQAVSTLDDEARSDLSSINLDAGSYVPRLSTKWVGLTTTDHPKPYTAQEIKSEIDGYKQQFGNVKVVKANAIGKQNDRLASHPQAWLSFADQEFSSADEAQSWCDAHVGSDIMVCGPQALNHAHR